MIESKLVETYWVKIYVAGDIKSIEESCRRFCMDGLCVTVTPTKFIYTGGQEDGAEVGLVNYPRFPSTPEGINIRAEVLAEQLMKDCCQLSVLVVTPGKTTWFSRRKEFEPK
jgi:hypothetical protein